MANAIYPITLRNAEPETTPLGEFAKLIDNLNTIIVETAHACNIELPEDQAVISLVDVEKGSNRLVFSFLPFMWQVLAKITASVEEGDFVALPIKAHNALHDISNQAKRQEWDVLFSEKQNQSYHIREVEISARRPISPPRPQFIKGTTTIFGRCVRVGGKTPKVDLELPNRSRLIHCETTKEIAINLSQSLYKNVALYGKALWDSHTLELVEFKATEIANQKHHSPVKALEEISELAGDQWKDTDVIDFINKIRSEGT